LTSLTATEFDYTQVIFFFEACTRPHIFTSVHTNTHTLVQEVFEDDRAVHLVMDLCEGGALLERVSSMQYSEKYIARLSRSILRFVSQCHAKGIIYRDIKVCSCLMEHM